MGSATFLLICLGLVLSTSGQDLPTVYEYFTADGIQTGWEANGPGLFKLNGRDIRIISGALHYFRVHPSLWRDRLKKLRAAGLNTVETYVPWNLHEPRIGQFDFGDGGNDFSPFLNVRKFIQMAQEEDLLVLFRPGPYICSEWEFGGFPSWLLRDPNMKVRTSYQPFLDYVTAYFDALLPQVADLQFTNGGPIIGIQIENEYGSFYPIHKSYLEHIKNAYDRHGFTGLQFTSDGAYNGADGSLPELGVLMTANFQGDPKSNLDRLLEEQPDKPTMVMEYWSGWFDHWFEEHHTVSVEDFGEWLEGIFTHSQTSVNFYMFHGGTNFGFMNGANRIITYTPDITSYDYDAPLSEAGDYTEKFYKAMELIRQYEIPQLFHPELPEPTQKIALPTTDVTHYLTFPDILGQIPVSSKFESERVMTMELLDMNDGSGQGHGYIVYETTVEFTELTGTLTVHTPVHDFGIILLDDEIVGDHTGNRTDYWMTRKNRVNLTVTSLGSHRIAIVVENMGRVNFGYEEDFEQHKGLTGELSFNDQEITGFTIYAAEFKQSWVEGLTNWRTIETGEAVSGPAVFQTTLTLAQDPVADTFLDMRNWHKGIVFINGFNLGRYFKVGPQQTLYLPAPFLHAGENTITIFEQLEPSTEVRFTDTPILACTGCI